MKNIFTALLLLTVCSNSIAQVKFFQRQTNSPKWNILEKVKQRPSGYFGVTTKADPNDFKRYWISFDTLGLQQSNHLIDTTSIIGQSYIEFGIGWRQVRYHYLGNRYYFPTFKRYLYSNYDNKTTACLSVVDSLGYLVKNYDYDYHNPARFTHHTISVDNKILACGVVVTDTISGPIFCDALVAKLDTNGNELWHYRYVGSYAQEPGGISATPDSGAVVVLASGGWPGGNEVRIIKLSKTGQLEWMRKPPLPIGISKVNLIDYDPLKNDFVLLTYTYPDSMIIAKYDSYMKTKWEIRQKVTGSGGSNNLYITEMIKDKNGYIGCGEDSRNAPDTYGYVLKIEEKGTRKWEASFNGDYKINGWYATSFFGIDTTSDGGCIIGGTTRDSLGNYTTVLVKLDSTGCLTDTACETRYFTGITPLSEGEGLGVRLYPNPTSNSVTISINSTETKELHYTITNLVGQSIQEGSIIEKETTIDIHNLSSGMYVVNVIGSKGERWSGKVVKE